MIQWISRSNGICNVNIKPASFDEYHVPCMSFTVTFSLNIATWDTQFFIYHAYGQRNSHTYCFPFYHSTIRSKFHPRIVRNTPICPVVYAITHNSMSLFPVLYANLFRFMDYINNSSVKLCYTQAILFIGTCIGKLHLQTTIGTTTDSLHFGPNALQITG